MAPPSRKTASAMASRRSGRRLAGGAAGGAAAGGALRAHGMLSFSYMKIEANVSASETTKNASTVKRFGKKTTHASDMRRPERLSAYSFTMLSRRFMMYAVEMPISVVITMQPIVISSTKSRCAANRARSADMTIRKNDNYYAFATAEEPIISPYLEVTEHTKHYLQMSMLFITINAMYHFYEIKVQHLFAA